MIYFNRNYNEFYYFYQIAQLLSSDMKREVIEHCQRVREIIELWMDIQGIKNTEKEYIRLAAQYHDIGKLAISENVLLKKSKLTDREWNLIQKHPVIGYEMFKRQKDLRHISKLILHHHERWDGTGYPLGLKKESIPYGARMIAIVDAFDSMTSERVYRKRLKYNEALDEIIRCSGTQFDPELAESFMMITAKIF